MASEPENSGPGRSATGRSPERPAEVAALFGGGVHLATAVARAGGTVVVAAGFSADDARARADGRAGAFDALAGLPSEPAGAADLRLADFMPEPPVAGGSYVAGAGVLSGRRYLAPAEVVRLKDRASRVEPTTVGLVTDRSGRPCSAGCPDSCAGACTGIADVLAHDVFIRWWADPRVPLVRVSGFLPALLPPAVAASLPLLGLWVSAFVVPGSGFRLAVVGLGGDGGTIATAGARSVREAVREAFLRAVAARAQPWDTLLVAESLRRLMVWHHEADYLAYLEGAAVDGDDAAVREQPGDEAVGWAEMAFRRFGHEPIAIGSPSASGPVKVICPGAACYRPVPPGTTLPCPVP